MITDPILLQISTLFFALAVIHTFCTKQFNKWAHRFPDGSGMENLFHFLGEVEVVFGLWAFLFLFVVSTHSGTSAAANYLNQVNFSEAVFVFVIMCLSSTRPVMQLAERLIRSTATLLPIPKAIGLYATILIIGPLLGSFITEPAAMTVTALLLKKSIFENEISNRLRYGTLGLLFVNVSIGGTLTHFAAPPILMVVGPWKWDLLFVLKNIGTKALISVLIGTIATTLFFWRELSTLQIKKEIEKRSAAPAWLIATHLIFMFLTIVYHTQIAFFLPLFLLFLGVTEVTREHQSKVNIKEGLLVGFFLGGLVTLGGLQGWWLKDLVAALNPLALFLSATGLTAITDNAALTYLGTLVPNLTDSAKIALVGGAVAGGGLTVIANAPNPAGYGILKDSFGAEGISPLGLFFAALPCTILFMVIFLVTT